MLHLLNLACIKHTGQPLPSSAFGSNRWSYKNDEGFDIGDNGEVIKVPKKLAIHRGLPDITPNCIPDDPEFRIARSLVVGEIHRIRNMFNDANNLKIIWGSISYLLTVMNYYQKKIVGLDPNSNHKDIQFQPLKVIAYCSNITKPEPLVGYRRMRDIDNADTQISKISKLLSDYWADGGYPFHYDYNRFYRKVRDNVSVKHLNSILLKKFYLSDNLFHPDATFSLLDHGNHCLRDKVSNIDHQTITLQRFYTCCKMEDLYIDSYVVGYPKSVKRKDRDLYKKWWDKDSNFVYSMESKIMREKVKRIDCEKDKNNNSKIFTSMDSVKKTKYALEKYYELVCIAQSSSLNLDLACFPYPPNPVSDAIAQFRVSGKEPWRQEILRKDRGKLSGDEIMRILAPNKKEEKKVIMDKFVSSFNQ